MLEVYQQPYDPEVPQVCMDEASKQLIAEVRPPEPTAPGKPAREDSEYVRMGVAEIFLVTEPLTGETHVQITEHRAKKDWALFMKQVVDRYYPKARRIRVVLDNLNTHTKASLYEAFPPDEAKRIADKLEVHYTPKHGSWLNIAECQLSVLSRQCLNRRIADLDTLRYQTTAWEQIRSHNKRPVDWRFTTQDARIRLKRLYPSIQT